MKRIKYGSGKDMTPEQKKEHIKELQKNWRAKHRDRMRANNHYWSMIYQQTKPFKCTCEKCGNTFYASRNSVKTCPNCVKEKLERSKLLRNQLEQRRANKAYRNKQILLWNKKGWYQEAIAAKLGICQGTVSYVLRKNGIITQVKNKRTVK